MEDKAPSKVEGAIERLNQDPYLLAAITAVPVIGGSITQVLTGIGQQTVQERNTKLFEQLSEHLADVDKQSIKQDYFETPEGFDLLIKALDESRKTRSDEKRDLIARMLRGATVDYQQGTYSPEEYLYLISDLTVQELEVARVIYETRPGPRDEIWKAWEEKACATIGIDKTDLHLALNRLGSTGLLQPVTAGEDEDDTDTFWVSAPKFGESYAYRVTPSFEKLMEFLSLRD